MKQKAEIIIIGSAKRTPGGRAYRQKRVSIGQGLALCHIPTTWVITWTSIPLPKEQTTHPVPRQDNPILIIHNGGSNISNQCENSLTTCFELPLLNAFVYSYGYSCLPHQNLLQEQDPAITELEADNISSFGRFLGPGIKLWHSHRGGHGYTKGSWNVRLPLQSELVSLVRNLHSFSLATFLSSLGSLYSAQAPHSIRFPFSVDAINSLATRRGWREVPKSKANVNEINIEYRGVWLALWHYTLLPSCAMPWPWRRRTTCCLHVILSIVGRNWRRVGDICSTGSELAPFSSICLDISL